jgi:negative regulator of sigma E activity
METFDDENFNSNLYENDVDQPLNFLNLNEENQKFQASSETEKANESKSLSKKRKRIDTKESDYKLKSRLKELIKLKEIDVTLE